MNRQDKRNLKKKGLSEKAIQELEVLSTPCTIAEAVQVARGVVDDAMKDYHARLGSLAVVQTLHIEVMKNLLIEKGLVTKEDYEVLLNDQAKKYDERKKEIETTPVAEVDESVEPVEGGEED